MSQSQATPVDFSQPQARSPVTQRPWLQSSSGLGWQHLSLVHKRIPPLQTPELQPLQHIIEINLSLSSSVECRADGRLYQPRIRYGAMMLAPAEGCYQMANLGDMESLTIALDRDFVARSADEILDAGQVELMLTMGTFDPLIYGVGMALKTELEAGAAGAGLYIDSLANTLATHLLRRYTSRSDARMVAAVGTVQHDFTQVIDYIETYLEQPIELEELAQIAGMSRFYFCRLFKASIGVTPHQFVIRRRVERAKRLLGKSGLSIAEVAIACGFANQDHLTRYFKRVMQVTPGVFRRGSQ
jgi:AraC family transcriptional regulator